MRISTAAVACLLWLAALPAHAQETKTLEVISFPGGGNWPFWIGAEQGYFTRNGVSIHLTPTPGSIFQITNLMAGKFDIGMTAIDNVIAYDEGQGEATLSGTPDLFAFMGGDDGFLHVVTLPEIKSFTALKGRELTVDARTTGFAFVLEKMLEKNGLKNSDYSLVKVGGTLERFQDLIAKKHAGTLLNTPFDLLAGARGFTDLTNASKALGHYQATIGAARRSWAKDHRRELVGFIRGYVASLGWLFDRRNKEQAVMLLEKNTPNLAPEMAEKIYTVMVNPKDWSPKASMDVAGIKTVLALRSQYGEPRKKLTDPKRYYELSYYQQATKQ